MPKRPNRMERFYIRSNTTGIADSPLTPQIQVRCQCWQNGAAWISCRRCRWLKAQLLFRDW